MLKSLQTTPRPQCGRGVVFFILFLNSPCNFFRYGVKSCWKHICGRPQGATNTLRPCTSGMSTQHSDTYRTIGNYTRFGADFQGRTLGFVVRAFEAVLSYQNSAPLYVSNKTPRAGARPPSALRGFVGNKFERKENG